ncbi:MAG: hypothetical protein J6C23_02660 [Clostridia bacterium]|nr:hypothetical protein [Clostridia bacterium]MBO5223396.1 hypothetical protein [Clostridia bacterium]
METIILSILLALAVTALLCLYYAHKKLWFYLVNDYKDEPHFCNYCKTGFINTKAERAKTTCDYCGRPLTLHKEHPNYAPPSDNDKPFEDFDFDTWLENQPEGTFVQGGGIDTENSQNNDKKD